MFYDKKTFLPVVVLGILTIFAVVQAEEFSSTNFIVKDPVVKPGAGFSTSTGFQLWSSLGQEAIGTSDATTFGLKGGFLYFPAPSTATTTPKLGSGNRFIPEELKPVVVGICDFNDDGECNIADLSILLYHFDRSGQEIARYDLNKNGRLDIADISILFYYWTELT